MCPHDRGSHRRTGFLPAALISHSIIDTAYLNRPFLVNCFAPVSPAVAIMTCQLPHSCTHYKPLEQAGLCANKAEGNVCVRRKEHA